MHNDHDHDHDHDHDPTAVAAILAYYRPGAIGAEWYRDARSSCRRLARDYGVSERTAAGIVAALSPRLRWNENLTYAESVLEHLASGIRIAPPVVPVFSLSRDRAWRIALGERPLDILSGDKTRAFYRCLTGDLDAVAVDIWAARAAGETRTLTPRRYARVAAAYRAAARSVGLAPSVLQAIVWCAIRGSAV